MGHKKTGGCKCRSRRGRRKVKYRSPEEAASMIDRYGLINSEVYRCPAPGEGWHLRHAKPKPVRPPRPDTEGDADA